VLTPIAVPLDYRRCVLKVASGLRGSRLANALFILHSREALTREENGVGEGVNADDRGITTNQYRL